MRTLLKASYEAVRELKGQASRKVSGVDSTSRTCLDDLVLGSSVSEGIRQKKRTYVAYRPSKK